MATIAEELSTLAEWLYAQAQELNAKGLHDVADAFDAQSRKVGALSSKHDGRVSAEPCVVGGDEGGYAAFLHDDDTQHTGNGTTPADAVANLQALIDGTAEEAPEGG